MGISDKKQTTNSTSTTNSNVTQSPINPPYVDNALQGLVGQITDLSNANPTSFTPGPNGIQQQTYNFLSGLDPNIAAYGSAEGLFQGLMDTPTPQVGTATAQAASLLPGLQQYMSPYLNNVVNSSLADYNFGAGQTQAANKLALAGDDTFGGSGGAIQTAMSNDAIDRGRASLVSGLLNQGYGQAATMANEDADRAQQVALANAAATNQSQQFNASQVEQALNRQRLAGEDLANTAGQNTQQQLAIAQAKAGIGDTFHQIDQAQALAPLSLLGTQASLFSGLPLSLVHGQNTNGTSTTTSHGETTTSDPMGTLGSVLGGVGSLGMGLGAMGLGFGGMSGGLLGQLGAGSLSGLAGFGAGLGLTPMTPITVGAG